MKLKRLLIITLVFIIVLMAACEKKPVFMDDNAINNTAEKIEQMPGARITGTITIYFCNSNYEDMNPQVKDETLNFAITAANYKAAPITVTNFIKLITDKYLVDTYVSASSATHLILGKQWDVADEDDPNIKRQEDKDELGHTIIGEFKDNKWNKNDTKIEVGSLYMILSGGNNSAESAFGIVRDENHAKSLKNTVAVFGQITNVSSLESICSKIGNQQAGVKVYIRNITINPADPGLGNPITIKK